VGEAALANDLVSRILARARITSPSRRSELERELQSHLDHIVTEMRANGYSEVELERIVRLRFGNPEDIGEAFAITYRCDRLLYWSTKFAALAILSVAAVTAFVFSLQVVAARMTGVSLVRAFPRPLGEIVGFVFLTCGYLVTRYGQKLFGNWSRLLAIVLSGFVLAALSTLLHFWMPSHTLTPATVFVSGAGFSLLCRTRLSLNGLVAVAAPFLIMWWISGPLVLGSQHIERHYLPFLICLDLAVSCRILQALADLFERRILRYELQSG